MSTGAANPDIRVVRPGDTGKANPFTIAIVSNPALEQPYQSGTFAVDPITGDPSSFDGCVAYIDDVLFGNLPGQAEKLFADPAIAPAVRILSVFVTGLPASDSTSLVGEDDGVSDTVIPRRTAFIPFLANLGLHADVAYAVTASPTHQRASAWFTSDDDARGGVPFTIDGVQHFHRYYNLIPGTIALPVSSTSLTALHELGHALSSYSNGSVLDLYVDSNPGLNVRRGRPIPATFATYNGTPMATDPVRDGLGYTTGWQSYHCELLDPANPAIMDDYWQAPGGSNACRHDRITRQFLKDRLLAKISRP